MKVFKCDFDDDGYTSELQLAFARKNLDIDYAAVCRPTREVPCSFLETESLPDGTIVFAVGDSGPVPDPLPVLCIRHYLRRSVAVKTAHPSLVAARVNQLIYDCCAASCSLSCFHAQYSRDSSVLRYINAGHDAPLLVRSDPEEVVLLENGGPVFGLQESPRYVEGRVQLKPGDRLVAFTQGIIDSLASAGRSAESALISQVRKRRHTSAAEIAQRIMAECEAARCEVRVDRSVFVAAVDDGFSTRLRVPMQACAAFA
jgi:sigma-B regulation protein RsbU (phosphoserine phosphatase)